MSAIDDRYNALGGPTGFLGPPISDEQAIGVGPAPVHVRLYQFGAIYWIVTEHAVGHGPFGISQRTTQTFEVHGAIWEHYKALGREGSFLGYPTSDETPDSFGTGRLNHFQGGMIYWTGATGAHEVHGAILAEWQALGAERSYIGRPVSDEEVWLSEKLDIGGRRNRFEHGEIDWIDGEAIPWPNSYTFAVDAMRILNTRSRDADTDRASASVAVGDGPPQTVTKDLGDVDNGGHQIQLTVGPVTVGVETGVAFNYLVVNAGHASWDDVNGKLRDAGGKLAAAGAAAATTAVSSAVGAAVGSAIGTVALPVIGTAIGVLAGWIAGELVGLLTADCDGAVAAELAVFHGQDLWNQTRGGPHAFSTVHDGTDSPAGCGSNSVYWVYWTLARVPLPAPS